MKKVLISAFAVSPIKGSEGGLGWNYCSRIGEYAQATVLYGSEKRTFQRDYSIDKYLEENGPIQNVKFIWIEASPMAKRLLAVHDKTGLSIVYYWAYNLWQKKAYRAALKLDKDENFDIIHQLNMIGFREPGYLWRLGKPFVWGPVGGTVTVPLRFFAFMNWKGKCQNLFRNVLNYFQLKYSLNVRKAISKCSCVIAASSTEQYNLKRFYSLSNSCIINETGSELLYYKEPKSHGAPIKILWSGTHTPNKALPILLNALAEIKDEVDYELFVLGSGTETALWKTMAVNMGLDRQISWFGNIPRKDAIEIMAKTDITVFTSLKETTSTIIFESISMGNPVICLDICGMKDVINSECGIKINPGSSSEIVRGFSDAIKLLSVDSELLRQLSDGAFERAKQMNWENKMKMFCKVYQEV